MRSLLFLLSSRTEGPGGAGAFLTGFYQYFSTWAWVTWAAFLMFSSLESL